MVTNADIAIIGAGLAGAATAFHLRRLGQNGVVILEQEALPGQHSSGLNASIVRERVNDIEIDPLAAEGTAALRTGEYGTFRPTGSVLIGMGNDDAAKYCPLAVGRGLWCPGDGVADPAGVLQTYLRGQDVRYETRLLSWRPDGDGVELQTDKGILRAGLVVNAAGPWAGSVGDIAVSPMNRHLFLTSPVPSVEPDWPLVWDVDNGLYFRPEGGCLLMCACDDEVREPGDYRVDHDVETRLAYLLDRHQPALRDVAIKTRWTGQRMFVEDRRFVIGFDPRCAQMFHVAGLGGHGVTCSYAVGRVAAELITGDRSTGSNPFDPARLFVGANGERRVKSEE